MRKRYVPFALLFAILLGILLHLGTKLTAVPTFTFAKEEKCVYLTFDDGPSTQVTGRILDILKEEQIKATFFIVSDRASNRQDTLRRIAAEGHTLGVHSASHDYASIYASDQALLKDVDTCAAFIRMVTGITPRFYRFPGGGFHRDRQTALLKQKGYRIVHWNAVCGDEEIAGATPEQLVEETIRTSRGKRNVVLLCHDSALRTNTAEALPDIIAYYRAEGYAFCAF